jgi:hypothetical protein
MILAEFSVKAKLWSTLQVTVNYGYLVGRPIEKKVFV